MINLNAVATVQRRRRIATVRAAVAGMWLLVLQE
jgi:hypothetical protein